MKYLLALLLTLFYGLSYAAALPQAEPVPGGIAVVALSGGDRHAPSVYFNGLRMQDSGWRSSASP
jgi:hypothetical protein